MKIIQINKNNNMQISMTKTKINIMSSMKINSRNIKVK